MSANYKGIVIIAVVIWLLFFDGLSALQRATANYAANGAPVIPAIANGVNRVLATPQVIVQSQGAPRIVVQQGAPQGVSGAAVPQQEAPTATPEPIIIITATPEPLPTATPVVIVPQGLPEAAKMPTETPLPTFPPARYPSAGMQYALHTDVIEPDGTKHDCVYIYSLNKRVCWSTGVHPSESDVKWIVGMTEAGNIAGEPIPTEN